MSPIILHHKTSKRKLKDSFSHETREKDTDFLDKESTRFSSFYDSLSHVDDALVKDTDLRLKTVFPRPRKTRRRGSSFSLLRRQNDQPQEPSSTTSWPSLNPSTSVDASTNLSTISTPSIDYTSLTATDITTTTTSPLPTATQKPEGQSPLASLAVQLILGGLACLCLICIFIRCVRIGLQHDASIETRRRNLESARAQAAIHASALGESRGGTNDGATRTHLVMTNQITLAARLNMYQARTGVRVSLYPYGQEPLSATTEGPLESVNSFVAPSYECDVSPPPFMTTSGKPPEYSEIVIPVRAPTQPSRPPEPPRET